jgi:hypothetical protein
MGNSEADRPHIPPPHPGVAPGFSMPKEPAEHPDYGDEGVQQRRNAWTRLKAWFAREPGRHDSYVSNVTNPDDRRFIPRR